MINFLTPGAGGGWPRRWWSQEPTVRKLIILIRNPRSGRLEAGQGGQASQASQSLQ